MGGSSGGGGGSSGAVSYPAYMEAKHSTWLNEVAALITAGVAGDNPYTTAAAYDPDTALADSAAKLALFNDIVIAFDPDGDWADLWTIAQNKLETAVFSDTLIDAKVAAYNANVMARYNTSVLPRYQRGMQDVRAIMTSAFTIGESLLTADVTRDVNKFEADLKRDNEMKKNELISHATDKMLEALGLQLEGYKTLSQYTTETNRIKIVSKQEENERNIKFDEQDALWDLELYQFGNNVLASIAGAASVTKGKEVSTGASVLGGAMSGAAAGMAISGGNPIGAGIGAVVGGIGGLL